MTGHVLRKGSRVFGLVTAFLRSGEGAIGKVKGHPITGHQGPRVVVYSFLTSVQGGGEWSAPCSGCFTPGKDPVPVVQEAGWAPGPVWMCAENLTPTGIRSPDRPARSQSLYRLSYPAQGEGNTLLQMLYLWKNDIPNNIKVTIIHHTQIWISVIKVQLISAYCW
jgi:hypothetical protein